MTKLFSKWQSPFVFERVSNIYTFSKDPLLKKNVHKHIFLPWNEKFCHEFMFKLKKQIIQNGKCHVPFLQDDLEKSFIEPDLIKELQEQIEAGIETHLIMSNLDSIHIYRLDEIHKSKKLKSGIEELDKNSYPIWFELGDMYVHQANHVDEGAGIEAELESLIMDQQTHSLFVPSRWVEMERNLTYDYFIRTCELEENVYQDSWNLISKRTQHSLVRSELARHEGIMLRDEEKIEHLKESFDHYFDAVLNELNEVYIRPLVNAFHRYDCLREAWDELQSGLVHPVITDMINHFINDENSHIEDIQQFLEYQASAKSFLFSLKNKFTKKINNKEFLLIENFLCRQESLIESFSCRQLYRKLESLLEIKACLNELISHQNSIELNTLKDYNLKLTHLLTIMNSTSYEDNIFFKLVEEKTSKGVIKRSFEDEVKHLKKLGELSIIKKAA